MNESRPLSVELTAQAEGADQRLTQILRIGETTRLGRAPKRGMTIPWDSRISREHADLQWDGQRLRVTCLESARNKIKSQNKSARELFISIGGEFRIGSTRFKIFETEDQTDRETFAGAIFDTVNREDVIERSFTAEELIRASYSDPKQQMELLSNLPQMISSAQSDEELAVRLARLLLEAIPNAECVAVAQFDEADLQTDEALLKPIMMRIEKRTGFEGRFCPSRRLIVRALQQKESVVHLWDSAECEERFTVSKGLDWAFCLPISGQSSRGWCLYVSGKGARHGGLVVSDENLKGDVRFTQLVAQFIGAVRQVRVLQEQKTQLSTFFSPKVIQQLTNADARQALTPAERQISVLFCDVRGFSRKAESMSGDLYKLLFRSREALSVMARGILNRDGTIADFQGDAALGFWGWPVELDEGPLPACRAALDIDRAFRQCASDESNPLHGFSVGMGIIHGLAIAGQIGTETQAKVGVFGPVVNLGARLESMTKLFGTSICIGEATADWVERSLPKDEGRLRRLARVRPRGMDKPLTVFGLLPPLDECPSVSDQMIADYDAALDAAIAGQWDTAIKLLKPLPDCDRPKQFLLEQIAAVRRPKITSWDGAFTLTSK